MSSELVRLESMAIAERFEYSIGLREPGPEGQSIAIRGPSDLTTWLKGHDHARYLITRDAEEQFGTPIPYPDVLAWREAAGYDYGDNYPGKLFWSLTFAEAERPPHHILEAGDSLIRLNLLIPRRADSKSLSALSLAVHFDRESDLKKHAGKVNWPRLNLYVGSGQLSEYGVQLEPRASQELLLVATRILLGKASQGDQPQKPKRRLLGRRRAPESSSS